MRRIFDVNAMNAPLNEKLATASSALGRTAFGRGGVVKAEIVDGRVKFVVTATGDSFDNVDLAFNRASSMNLNEVVSFGRRISDPFNRRMTNRYGAFADILDDMYEKIDNLDASQKALLKKYDIDVDALRNLQLDIITMNAKEDKVKGVITELEKFRESGKLHGITMIDDEGARVLSFRYNQNTLTSVQANILMAVTGHDMTDREALPRYLAEGNANGIAKMFEKSIKRQKGYLSSRDLSLAGDELTQLIGRFAKGATSLNDITLVTDPQYELLMKFALGKKEFGKLVGKDKANYYKYNPIKLTIKETLEGLDTKYSDDELEEFKKAIRKFDPQKLDAKHWSSDQLKRFLLDGYAKGDEKRSKLVENIYKSIEQSDDGSTQLNRKFLRQYEMMLQEGVSNLTTQINDHTNGVTKLSAEQLHEAKMARLEKRALLERLRNGELGQITGRGGYLDPAKGAFSYNVKTAYDASQNFRTELSKYGLVISKFSLKRDTSIAGNKESFILSGIGKPRDIVYADPISTAFHPEVFADPQTKAAIRANIDNVMQEYRATIESGVVPDKLKRLLEEQAAEDIDILPANVRSSALRNREFAQAILDMLKSGIRPTDSPAMMSMLHNAYATQAFREVDGFLQPALPYTYRFQLDTEKLGDASGRRRLLGREKFDGIVINGQPYAENADILNFRIEGHKMLLPHYGPGQYFNSLGGFDLDDKGLPKLVTYADKNSVDGSVNRLGFYIYRQPTGVEEIIFARARLDQETIKALFNNTLFRDELEQMFTEGRVNSTNSLTTNHMLLKESLDSGDFKTLKTKESKKLYKAVDIQINRNQAGVEGAIIDVLTRLQAKKKTSIYSLTEAGAAKIGTKGATLALSDLVDASGTAIDSKFTRQGVFKVFLDEGAFDMSQDILGILDKSGVNQSLKTKLQKAYESTVDPSQKFPNMLKALSAEVSGDEASAIMSAAKEAMQIARVKQSSGNLGQYVNRTAAAGSVLNQYEAFMEELALPKQVKKEIFQRYSMGILAQETAIDMSVNFSRAKILSQATRDVIEQSMGGLSEDATTAALKKVLGLAPGAAVGLNELGEMVISQLGRSIGFSRAVEKGVQNKELLLGIDEFMLTNRMSAGDRFNVLEGIIFGMEDAKRMSAEGKITGDILYDSLDKDLKELKGVLGRKNNEEIQRVLAQRIGLGASHTYSGVSALHALGRYGESGAEAIRASVTARITSKPSLMTAVTTAEERAAARMILDQNKANLELMFDFGSKNIKELAELEKLDLEYRFLTTSRNIYQQIQGATQLQGVSFKGLVTAIDQNVAQSGSKFDLAALRIAFTQAGVPVEEGFDKVINKVIQARRLRDIDFIEKFDTQNAVRIIDQLSQAGKDLSMDNIASRANQILDTSTVITGLDDNILMALAGRASEIDDDLARQQAKLEASIVEGLVEKQSLVDQGVIDSLLETGKATDLTDEIRGLGIDDDMIDTMRRSIEEGLEGDTTQRATYKRLTRNLFKEDKGLVELIKNPMVRKGALGLGALILGSFAYSAVRDRTAEDVKGPPLLPGGSAYETDYPQRGSNIGDFSGQGYNPGMTYRVNIYGDRSQLNQFSSAAGELSNGNISTTMYNRIPDVNRDQYSELASMF